MSRGARSSSQPAATRRDLPYGARRGRVVRAHGARSPSTWPVRPRGCRSPDELWIDLDPSPGPTSTTRSRSRRGQRACWTSSPSRLSQDLGWARHPHLRADRAALDLHRRPPRRDRLRRELERRCWAGSPCRSGGRRSAARECSWTTTRTPRDDDRLLPYSVRRSPGLRSRRRSTGTRCRRSSRRTSRSSRCSPASPRSATVLRRSTTRTLLGPLLEMYEAHGSRGEGDALPARLPQDAGRAEARCSSRGSRLKEGRLTRSVTARLARRQGDRLVLRNPSLELALASRPPRSTPAPSRIATFVIHSQTRMTTPARYRGGVVRREVRDVEGQSPDAASHRTTASTPPGDPAELRLPRHERRPVQDREYRDHDQGDAGPLWRCPRQGHRRRPRARAAFDLLGDRTG